MKRRVTTMLRRWFARPLIASRPSLSFRPRLECLEDRLAPATFTVINTNDTGAGSLRQQILLADSVPGSTINFNIPGGPTQFIVPLSALPAITASGTIIDATTQPGFISNSQMIVINGLNSGTTTNGLVFAACNGAVVKGLAIEGFIGGAGVLFVQSNNNALLGNEIGLDPTNPSPSPNHFGVYPVISNGNVIVGNVISGNLVYGVLFLVANNNFVGNNTIGLNAAKTAAVGNGVAGLAAAVGSSNNLLQGNTISGNGSFGVILADTGTRFNNLLSNTIGLNASGTPLPNGVAGVILATGASSNGIGSGSGTGNVISDNGLYGVLLTGAGTAGNTVTENFIGTNAAGTAAAPNGDAGVAIQDGAAGNLIGIGGEGNTIAGNTNINVRITGTGTIGNFVSGNSIGINAAGIAQIGFVDGVDIENAASGNVLNGNVIGGGLGVDLSGAGTTGNVLQANRIGTNAAGTAKLTAFGASVEIDSGASGNTIGGTTRALGNLLSSGGFGIDLFLAGAGNVIDNNLIGTNLAGNAALGQQQDIIIYQSIGTQILNNVISGSSQEGVEIDSCNNTIVAGNFIGTDTSGSNPVANSTGVGIFGASSGNVIGGTTAAARNVISGNTTDGVTLQGSGVTGNLVEANDIGTAANGTSALGNGKRGVFITQSAHDNTIGGLTAGTANVIAFNGDDGVLIGGNVGDTGANLAGPGNAVLGNSIFSNGKVGIDLGPDDGVTANNSAGLVLNSPTLSNAVAVGSSLIVIGNWQSTFVTPGVYRIEVFANTAADPSGHGQGKTFLGFGTVFVNTNSKNFALVLSASVAAGTVLSCTITDPLNNTSEFSTDVTVS